MKVAALVERKPHVYRPGGFWKNVGLLACGKSKLPNRAPAKDLYTGQLFRAGRAYLEATCHQWAILSARHGLVMPDLELEPYEKRVPHNREERAWWARNIHHQILNQWCLEAIVPGPEDELGGRPPVWRPKLLRVRFIILAGTDYREVMAPDGWDTPIPFDAPLANLGIGQQLGWLKGAIDGLRTEGKAGS